MKTLGTFTRSVVLLALAIGCGGNEAGSSSRGTGGSGTAGDTDGVAGGTDARVGGAAGAVAGNDSGGQAGEGVGGSRHVGGAAGAVAGNDSGGQAGEGIGGSGRGGGAAGGAGAGGSGYGGSESGGSGYGGSESGGSGYGGSESGGSGEAGSAGAVTEQPNVEGMGFDVSMTLDPSSSSVDCDGGCVNPLLLYVEKQTERALEVVVGSTGHAERATFVRADSGWTLSEPVMLQHARRPNTLCEDHYQLLGATVTFSDPDGDGTIRLNGTGSDEQQSGSDDTCGTYERPPIVIAGSPHARTPAWAIPLDPICPLDVVSLGLDTPLPASAEATLTPVGGAATLPLSPTTEAEVIVGFGIQPVLELSSTYTVDSPTRDIAGYAAPSPTTIATVEDPGVLADGTFETGISGVLGLSGAEPQWVNALAGFPALEGNNSLYVDAGAKVLLHLTRSESESTLVVTVRKFQDSPVSWCNEGDLSVVAGVVGGTARVTNSVVLGDDTETVELPSATVTTGAIEELRIPLEDAGSEVLLTFATENFRMASCRSSSALIDGIHFE